MWRSLLISCLLLTACDEGGSDLPWSVPETCMELAIDDTGSGTDSLYYVDLPYDPTAGCPNFADEGCETCCEASVTVSGSVVCSQQSDAGMGGISVQTILGPCPEDCQPCASCTDAMAEIDCEQAVTEPRPDCDCDVEGGQLPCLSQGTCRCACTLLDAGLPHCPHLAFLLCRSAFDCGTYLVVDSGPHAIGDTLQPAWVNASADPAYLPGCTTYEVVGGDSGDEHVLTPPGCSEQGNVVRIEPFSIYRPLALELSGPIVASRYFLEGTYLRGCTDGQPYAAADCSEGPWTVTSPQIMVMAAE